MKFEIIEKAIHYLWCGDVLVDQETKDFIYFSVDNEIIKFYKHEGYLKMDCTCTFCSNKNFKEKQQIQDKYTITNVVEERNVLCSRKLACLFYLESRTLREGWAKSAKKDL